ncbi:phosphatase PAP2 family protein [Streptomyces sp. NPDC090106]|uniref:phosphatase PAP2 family protein n=1 Tax=Streptomyces sp. NPDC090106 TaxID=3365946 RepID=UPI003811BF4E
MAGLAASGSNPDVELLYDINGLAKDAPHWFDRVMEFVGEYGILLATVLVVLWCWMSVRRKGGPDAASSVAALIWAPLAAGVAVLVNVPIRGFVERPRPFLQHEGLEVLVSGKTDYSFVSDHATITMALAVGLFVAHRRFGLLGILLALLEGFCRVYMGVHYPTDVVGGFALGTAVALLLSPLAMALLTPLTQAVERSPRAGRLIRSRRAPAHDGQGARVPGARQESAGAASERDLAA